jgi:hypothetical protein
MIHVRTWDMPDGGVGIELRGHAGAKDDVPAQNDAEAYERAQVCSGASMLLVTLAALSDGTWQGNHSGLVVCLVPGDMLSHAEFALTGLMLLEKAYAGHVEIQRDDTRLGVEWKRAAMWAEKQDDNDGG